MNGAVSGLRTTSGDYNAFMGYQSGQFNVTGSQNVFLGANSGPSNVVLGNLTNAIAIGYNAYVRNNNHMILGNNSIYVGIGLSEDVVQGGPQNKLEINTNLIDHLSNNPIIPGSIAGTTGASGLRFRDLKVGSTALTINPHTIPSVLTVDANGDVVLVEDKGGSILGNICGATATNPLANSWEVIMQNKNYIFKDSELGSVGIGAFVANCAPQNTLEIIANANSPYSATNSSGLRLTRLTSASTIVPNGSSGVNSNKLLTVDENGDVVLTSLSAPTGVLGNYCANTDNPLTDNYEIPLNNNRFVFTGTGTVNIGSAVTCTSPNVSKFYVRNSNPNTTNAAIFGDYNSIGIAGSAIRGRVTTASDYAGYFEGVTWALGSAYANNGVLLTSDKRIKKEIVTIKSSLDIIAKLNPVSFKFNTAYAPQLISDDNKHFGFIAQEVESIIPELVKETPFFQVQIV